jgi:hypothetical protein
MHQGCGGPAVGRTIGVGVTTPEPDGVIMTSITNPMVMLRMITMLST